MTSNFNYPAIAESSLRRRAKTLGGCLSKSRHNGTWTLTDHYGKTVAYGDDVQHVCKVLHYASQHRCKTLGEAATDYFVQA